MAHDTPTFDMKLLDGEAAAATADAATATGDAEDYSAKPAASLTSAFIRRPKPPVAPATPDRQPERHPVAPEIKELRHALKDESRAAEESAQPSPFRRLLRAPSWSDVLLYGFCYVAFLVSLMVVLDVFPTLP